MGKALVTPIYSYKGPQITESASATLNTPFQPSVTGDQVTISLFSYLLEDFDVRDNIFILGLGFPFKIEYGEKIYLETVFDSNGQVAYARIDHNAFWPIYQNGAKAGDPAIQIYPSAIANLSSSDASQYKAFLTDQSTRLQAQMTAHVQYLQQKVTQDQQNQDTEQAEQDQNLLDRTQAAYTSATTKLQSMQNSQAQFWGSSSSTGLLRKQVACYNVIAYTSQDDSTELNILTVTPAESDVKDGVTSFSLVPCISTDLMLNDVFYQYTGCRYPMAISRPVYYFLDPDKSGKSEDIENTKIS